MDQQWCWIDGSDECLKSRLEAKRQAKKSQHEAGLSIFGLSGRVCGHFCVMGNQRNEGVLLAMGELSEALKQFALMQ